MQGLTLRGFCLHDMKHHGVPLWLQLLASFSLMILFSTMLFKPLHAAEYDAFGRETSSQAIEEHAIISDLELTRRVLGGDDAELGDWPSMVAIATAGFFSLEDRFFCGGTLVAERYVLTAAHCLYDLSGQLEEVSNLRVVAGIHDLTTGETYEETMVTNLIIHPDYDNTQNSPPNDIALLELSNVVDEPVAQLFVEDSEDYVDTMAYILGWGATRYRNEQAGGYPAILQEGRVPLVSLENCNAPTSYGGLVEVTQLCAGYTTGGVDTCSGDSGGPLYILQGGQPVQVGITSFGNGCAEPDFYGIYTNISHFIPWLSDYIDVPGQSAELIASREAATNPGYTPDDGTQSQGSSGGALNPSAMLILLLLAATRLTACSAKTLDETPVTESEKQHQLSEQNLRAGVDALQLGLDRESTLLALPASHWHDPKCHTGKTAVRGSGRLFMTEQCRVQAREPQSLAGWLVPEISYVLIAQRLVRVDLILSGSGRAMAVGKRVVANKPGSRLTQLLDSHYEQRPDSSLQWRHGLDQIRFQPGSGLQFIDGQLEDSLPILFSREPEFE